MSDIQRSLQHTMTDRNNKPPMLQTIEKDKSYPKSWLGSRLERGKGERFSEIIMITPGLAARILEQNTNNRPLSLPRVKAYASAMARGEWRLLADAVELDRTGTLINGQHRLAAVVASGVKARFTIWFGVESDEFYLKDQGKSRTAADLATHSGHVDPKLRCSIASLIMFIEGKGGIATPHHVKARVDDMTEANPEGFDVAIRAAGKLKKIANKTSVGAAFWTIANSGAKTDNIEAFLIGMDTGESLIKPRLTLRNALITGDLSYGNNQTYSIRRAAGIILTWNAWRRNYSTVKLAWPHSTYLPEVTP